MHKTPRGLIAHPELGFDPFQKIAVADPSAKTKTPATEPRARGFVMK
jgi:hypothetical protein